MKRHLWILLSAVAVAVSGSSVAGTLQNYTPEALAAAQQAGRTIVLGFHSPSCGNCLRQKPALNRILNETGFQKIEAFTVPYKENATLRSAMHVTSPSTLVVLKGGEERARSVGMADESELRSLVRKGM